MDSEASVAWMVTYYSLSLYYSVGVLLRVCVWAFSHMPQMFGCMGLHCGRCSLTVRSPGLACLEDRFVCMDARWCLYIFHTKIRLLKQLTCHSTIASDSWVLQGAVCFNGNGTQATHETLQKTCFVHNDQLKNAHFVPYADPVSCGAGRRALAKALWLSSGALQCDVEMLGLQSSRSAHIHPAHQFGGWG